MGTLLGCFILLIFPNKISSVKKLSFTLFFKVLFMSQEKDYLQDLTEIRSIMEKSTRFISLSGLSGVFAGIVALIGAGIAHWLIDDFKTQFYAHSQDGFLIKAGSTMETLEMNLFILAFIVLVLALFGGYYFTARKAKRLEQNVWTKSTQQLLTSLFIPLVTGGLFCLLMYYHGIIGFIAPVMLIFYGLALVSSSKYTLNDIRYLGICEIVLGLVAMLYLGYGLYFWAFGFGILHIVYGISMYYKYEGKK